jgi:hypothetical protein
LPKNDERTQFEYKDHDPTRYAVESIIAFVPLKFVPETKVFRLYAGTVEALNIAVKHHDDMDTPVESTRKPARKSKKPAARETASKRRRSARASREEGDDEQEQKSEEDNEEREEEEDARLKAPSTQQSSRKAKKGAHDAACSRQRR